MKMLISVLMLAALSSIASAAVSQSGRNFPCKGPFMRPGGPIPVGAPSVHVVEQLVPMGPMLPAFKHVYYLSVKAMAPQIPATLYKLESVHSDLAPGVNVYKAVGKNGQASGYTVQHYMLDETPSFIVLVGNNGMHYRCK